MPLAGEQEASAWRQAGAASRRDAADLRAEIRREQVSYLTRGLVLSLLIHPLAATGVAMAVLGHTAHRMIAIWLLWVWALAAARGVYWHRHRFRTGGDSAVMRSARLLSALAAASSFAWGAAPLLIWPGASTGAQVLLLVAIAAATAIEMVSLASFMRAMIGALAIWLVALLTALAAHGLLTPIIVAAVLLYASVLAMSTYHINQLLFDSLRLRFELAQASTAAQAASKSKSDFIANMSHELRTPLNAIIGFSEMITMQIGDGGAARQIEYAQHIHRSGLHLLEIINDILDLSKIEAGRLELKSERVDLGEVVKTSLLLVAEHAEESGITIDASVPSPSPVIRGDDRALKQALLNLLSNAVKFTPIGGTVRLELRGDAAGGVVLAVTDTGIGMSPAEIPKAMQPFGQLGDVHTRSRSGTGLGLPIVRSLVEMHEGKLSLTSEPGVGTAAEIWLPPRRVIEPSER